MPFRRLLGSAILALATVSCATAQSTTLGITTGPVLSAILFDDPYSMDQVEAKVAAQATIVLARRVSKVLEIEAGIGFARTGFADIGAHYGSISMDILRAPIAVRAGLASRVSPFVRAGLAPSVSLRCRVTGSIAAESAGCDDPLVGTDYARFDLAAVGGVGVRFPVGAGEALVELGGSFGLLDMKRQPYPPGSARSVTIEVGIGYRLPLDRLFH